MVSGEAKRLCGFRAVKVGCWIVVKTVKMVDDGSATDGGEVDQSLVVVKRTKAEGVWMLLVSV